MRSLVAALRFAAFVALTAAAGALLAPCGPPARRRVFRGWCRAVLRVLGISVQVEGVAPRGPLVLVANHLSYLDVVVLGAEVDACFVAKTDVARWPALGRLAAALGTIFIDRSRKRDLLRVLPLVEARLRADETVVFFPEATSSAGHTLLPFRTSLFATSVRTGAPVGVAALRYATRPGDPPPDTAVCWWGEMEFLPHLFGLMRLRGVEARLELASEPLFDGDRKALARRARESVLKRLSSSRDGRAWG